MAKAAAKAAKEPSVRDEEKALRQRWRPADIASLQVLDRSWTLDDAQAALKLQASLKRHGQIQPVLCVTPPDGSTVVVNGRRILAAMKALGWTRCMVCDVGEADAGDVASLRFACELRSVTDYAALAQAVHGYLKAGVTTVERLASAGPWSAERVGYFDTLAVFDWAQFSEAEAGDGQVAMNWDDDDLPPPAPPVEVPAPEPLGPDSFGGEDFPMPPETAAAVDAAIREVQESTPPAPPPAAAADAAAAPAAPAKVKAKKPAPPPGPSLFDDIEA